MKVKCTKCRLEEDVNEDDVKLLAHVVKKYNPKPRPGDYMAVLSIIKGNCSDGEKHIFTFNGSFGQDVAATIKEHEDAIKQNVERKIALDKVCVQIEETANALKEVEKKKEYILAEMTAGGILIDNIKLKFFNLTGTEDMEIWK
jgi:hypothetical protein